MWYFAFWLVEENVRINNSFQALYLQQDVSYLVTPLSTLYVDENCTLKLYSFFIKWFRGGRGLSVHRFKYYDPWHPNDLDTHRSLMDMHYRVSRTNFLLTVDRNDNCQSVLGMVEHFFCSLSLEPTEIFRPRKFWEVPKRCIFLIICRGRGYITLTYRTYPPNDVLWTHFHPALHF